MERFRLIYIYRYDQKVLTLSYNFLHVCVYAWLVICITFTVFHYVVCFCCFKIISFDFWGGSSYILVYITMTFISSQFLFSHLGFYIWFISFKQCPLTLTYPTVHQVILFYHFHFFSPSILRLLFLFCQNT